MRITERIHQVRQEQADKTARDEETKTASAMAEERANLKRRDFIKQHANEVFRDCGVLDNFTEIEKALLQKSFKNHEIYEYESGATSNEPGYENRIIIMKWSDGDLHDDFYSIRAEFDHKTEDLIINASNEKRLNKSEWGNKEIVERLIAESFVNPAYYHYVVPIHESFDGGNC